MSLSTNTQQYYLPLRTGEKHKSTSMPSRTLVKQPLSTSSLINQIKYGKRPKQTKYSSKWDFCKVCGDKAHIINYGSLTCHSCKTFFRRNGLHPQNVPSCSFNSSCKMTRNTRRKCTACRLAKCFLVGMSADFIRHARQKNTKCLSSPKSTTKKLTPCNQAMSVPQLSTSDLSHNGRSLLLHSEQKVLSNVTHALDIYSAIPQVRRIIEEVSTSSLDLQFNVTDAMEIIILMHISMTSFIYSTPDFQVLTATEQCSLVERNLNGICRLYSAVVFRDADVLNNSHCMKSFASIYGLEMMIQQIRINRQLDQDLTIIKLMLIILAFSSNSSIIDIPQEIHNDSLLSGTYRLLGSQNVYVEILWKYMTSQYGYYDSALRFAQLIKIFLDLMKYSGNSYMNNTIYPDLANNLTRQTKHFLIINQNKQVSYLWG